MTDYKNIPAQTIVDGPWVEYPNPELALDHAILDGAAPWLDRQQTGTIGPFQIPVSEIRAIEAGEPSNIELSNLMDMAIRTGARIEIRITAQAQWGRGSIRTLFYDRDAEGGIQIPESLSAERH